MPGPILDSAAGADNDLEATFQLPTVTSPESDLLLVTLLQTRPVTTITPSAGWNLREQQDSSIGFGDEFRYELLDRVVSSPEIAYHDTFAASPSTRWGAVQLLFRRLGAYTPNTGKGYHEASPADTISETAAFGAAVTAGKVLVAIVTGTTGAGSAPPTGYDWPAGWTQILYLDASSFPAVGVDAMAVAYKIADGTETDCSVTIHQHNVVSCLLVVGEYPIDPAPEPPDPIGWDVFQADNLTGIPIATLLHGKGRWIRSELHGLGEGGFTVNRHSAEVTEEILAEGNMVKVFIPDCSPDYIDGFFLPGDGDYTLLSAQGGQGREDLVFRGAGALSYLDRARMLPCSFSLEDIVGTWTKQWVSTAVGHPIGVAYDPAEPGYVYVGAQLARKVRKIDQSTRAVVSSSPALWSGTDKGMGGISFDPDDATIIWVLEAPWLNGSTANTKIRKVRRSDWAILATYDLGSAVQLTDIRVDGDYVWTTRYDNDRIQRRDKSNPTSVTHSDTITYKGKLQRKPNGIAINGTAVAYWFGGDSGGGTGRALIANTSAPTTITGVQNTKNVSGFGGEWTTEGGDQFLYVVNYLTGKTYKYQLTDAIPRCADDSGVFHPDQVAPGAIAWRVLVEITHPDRPTQPCPELTYDFTEDEDSNGTPWPARTSTEEFTWRVGDRAFSDVLARLIPAGVTFDLDVNTMILHAYVDADFGTDRSAASFGAGKVRFVEAVNLAVNGDLGRRDNRGQPATDITVLGDGGVYGSATLAGRYVREGFMQVSGPSTEAVLDAIGDDELARERLVSDALGFETLWANEELVGKYIPKKHYWKGDLVRVDMVASEFAYDETDLRVYGTLISERDGGWRSALDLGSAYKIPEPIDSIPGSGSGSSSGGGGSSGGSTVITSIPLTVSDGVDVNIPRVTKIIAEGATSPEAGVAIIPGGGETGEPGLLEELETDETDIRLHPAPDGVGGVTWAGPGETPVDHGSMGSTETLDMLDGTWHQGTLSADCTITVEGFAVDDGLVAVVRLTQDGSGGWAVTWDADVVFVGDDQPGQDPGDVSWFLLWSDEGDATVYGARVGGQTTLTPATTVEDETTFGITPAVGTDLEYARQDHTHGTPDSPDSPVSVAAIEALGFVGPLLMQDGVTSPPVPIETEDGSDWLYADL